MSSNRSLPESENEGFFDVLKRVVKVGSAVGPGVLEAGTPFLGPIGSPIAAVAGTVLNFASKMADSTEAEGRLDIKHDIQGLASRPVLAEAALQTILQTGSDQIMKYNIMNNMQTVYNKQRAGIPYVTSQIMPAVMMPALRIAVYTAHKESFNLAESDRLQYPAMAAALRGARELTPSEQDFVTAITECAMNETGENDFSDFIGGVAKTALGVIVPGIGALESTIGSITSAKSDLRDPVSVDPNLETLAQRAVMADAALQALMKVNAHDMLEEGFLRSLIFSAKSIAPVVMQVAPSIVAAVSPVVENLLKPAVGSTTGEKQEKPVGKGVNAPPSRTTLMDLLLNDATTQW